MLVRRLGIVGIVACGMGLLAASLATPGDASARLRGIDVSNYQPSVDWRAVRRSGRRFAFVLATDGPSFTSPTFASQYHGAKAAHLIRGAYHFGRPGSGTAKGQAARFTALAGNTHDGATLPPALDMEPNPHPPACYGFTARHMVSWIRVFLAEVHRRTGRVGILYTGPGFWQSCTGNSRAFTHHHLWTADYGVSTPHSYGGWAHWTFWQHSSTGHVPGIAGNVDVDLFRGDGRRLHALAAG